MNAIEIVKYVSECGDSNELQAIGKAAYDRLRDVERTGDPNILAKLRLAKPKSILKVNWRGKNILDVEFQSLNRGTVSGFVRSLYKAYRFPVGWVKEVGEPDGKTMDPIASLPRLRRRRRGDGEDFD